MSVVFEQPGAKTATADNIVPECPGHFQTHRTMLLAYVNVNFVRDKVTLVYVTVERGPTKGEGVVVAAVTRRKGYFAISRLIRNARRSTSTVTFCPRLFAVIHGPDYPQAKREGEGEKEEDREGETVERIKEMSGTDCDGDSTRCHLRSMGNRSRK